MSLRFIIAAASVVALLAVGARTASACPAYDACILDAYAEYGELTQRAEEHFTECIHDPEKKYEDCERSRDADWAFAWQVLDYELAECYRDHDRLCPPPPEPVCGPGGYADYCWSDADCSCAYSCMEYCYYDPDWGYIGCCV